MTAVAIARFQIRCVELVEPCFADSTRTVRGSRLRLHETVTVTLFVELLPALSVQRTTMV